MSTTPPYNMNKLQRPSGPAAPAAATPSPDMGDSQSDADKARDLLQQLTEVVEHWSQEEQGEGEMPPAPDAGPDNVY